MYGVTALPNGEYVMKALSLREPWLQLIMQGRKRWEYRTWRPAVRSWPVDILLCASKALKAEDKVNVESYLPVGEIPETMRALGHARAVVRFAEVRKAGDLLGTPHQLPEGYDDSTWAWRVSEVFQLAEPIPLKGSLGLFSVVATLDSTAKHFDAAFIRKVRRITAELGR